MINQTKILPWFARIKNWLLPGACILCGTKVLDLDLCFACNNDLPWLSSTCNQCALPLGDSCTTETCGSCLKQPPPFDRTLALFAYQAPISKLITALKFNNKLVYARLFAGLLLQRLNDFYAQEPLPECIIPMPLHPQRLQERGFNQAFELSRTIAKNLKIPIDLNNCQRIKKTLAQTALSAKQRKENLKNAFSIKKAIACFEHVAIVDDVMTTRQTVTEFSKSLRANGIKRIDVWCCARTVISNVRAEDVN